MKNASTAPALASVLTSDGGRLRALILASVAITWAPLLVLSVLDGVAWAGGAGVPFLRDFLPYGQFLIAVPALLIAEQIVPARLNEAATALRDSGVVSPASRPEFERCVGTADAAWGGRGVNGLILLITIGTTIVSFVQAREWLTGSWQVAGSVLTLPGWWYLAVSLPVLRFLELRWIWRLLVWARFVRQTSALELEPRPSHPDRAGGLAFLGEAQLAFGWLVIALGVQVACLIADQVYFRGADLMASRGHVAAFVVISVLALLLPLLAFVPKLARVRYEAILFLSGRGFEGAGALDSRLRDSEGPLPDAEVSGLADYGVIFDNARLMRPIPFEVRHIVTLALVALLPFLPLVLLVMPAREILQTLAQLLL